MTTELLLQILIPAVLSFAAGHFHLILPFKGGTSSPALPTTFGHGELLSWFLSQLNKQQPTPLLVPATPATPSGAEAILIEVIQILKQVLQAQVVAPTPPVAPKAA